MKKLFLLASAALLLSGTANARQWKFNNWSSATVAQVKAAEDWTNDEKGDNSSNVVPDDACVWNVGANVGAACDENGNLLAGGSVIAELEGLKWTALGAKKIAIAFDYGTTTDANKWGPYEGGSYLWLNGKTTAVHFTIPAVAPGTEITMGLESHKPSDARGIDLYVNGTKVDKDPSAYPTTYAEYTWIVPGEEGGDPVDVDVQPSNGCHIYFINVKEGDVEPDVIKVAYLYDATYNTTTDGYGYGVNGGLDSDPIYSTLQSYEVEAIDLAEANQTLSTDELNDSLISFDVVVLSEAVGSGNKYAKALNGIINFVPMLNLKAYMYKNWGYGAGANPSPKATAVKVGEDYLDSPLFADVAIDDEGNITFFDVEDISTINTKSNLVQGYTATAGKLFADDEVIATVGTNNAIHTHGTRNQYMLIPISSDNLNVLSDAAGMLVYNAISVLAQTKSKVQNAGAPVIAQNQANNETTVTITSSTADATIYYTIDGTEPTEASTVYSEPFTVTVDSTVVKAFAVAHGYNNSDVTTATVRVFGQAAAPVISVDGATFTITAAEGAKIYYNYLGSNKVAESAVYSDTVTVAEPTTVTAFVTAENALQSEAVTANVTVEGYVYRYDILAHFDAKRAIYGTAENFAVNSNGSPYFFTWGKKAVSPYDSTNVVSTSVVPDVNGNDSTVYEYAIKAPETVESEDWVIASSGQIVTNESNTPILGVGDGSNGYYAESAEDTRLANDSIGVTSEMINFKGKVSGTPYTASISSKQKFAGPFDIIVYTANGGTGNPDVDLQVSTDGQQWDSIASVNYAQTRRYRCRTKVAYNETNEVYVRVAHMGGGSDAIVYDIYILNAGEHTQEVLGIRAIEDVPAVINGVTYNLFGQQVDKNYKGIVIRNGKKMILR